MGDVIRRLEQTRTIEQRIGTVAEIDSAGLLVDTEQGMVRARRAVSCLVEPIAGDRVLLAGAAGRMHYVLAVLERDGDAAVAIVTQGDLSLASRAGQIRVSGREGVALESQTRVEVATAEMKVNASEATIALSKLAYFGAEALAQLGRLRFVGNLFESFAERLMVRAKYSDRVVEEMDRVKAKHIEARAEQTMNLQATNALVKAKQLVKVDGDQIHLG